MLIGETATPGAVALVAAIVVAAIVAGASPARARTCMSETLVAEGISGKNKRTAMRLGIRRWRQLARRKYGPTFTSWRLARGHKAVCVHRRSGQRLKWICSVQAQACRPG